MYDPTELNLACRALFLRKFILLGPRQRRSGGQGVVQFARCAAHSGGGGGEATVAIKFFLNRSAFECEEALYWREELRGMMPAISVIDANEEVPPLPHLSSTFAPFW